MAPKKQRGGRDSTPTRQKRGRKTKAKVPESAAKGDDPTSDHSEGSTVSSDRFSHSGGTIRRKPTGSPTPSVASVTSSAVSDQPQEEVSPKSIDAHPKKNLLVKYNKEKAGTDDTSVITTADIHHDPHPDLHTDLHPDPPMKLPMNPPRSPETQGPKEPEAGPPDSKKARGVGKGSKGQTDKGKGKAPKPPKLPAPKPPASAPKPPASAPKPPAPAKAKVAKSKPPAPSVTSSSQSDSDDQDSGDSPGGSESSSASTQTLSAVSTASSLPASTVSSFPASASVAGGHRIRQRRARAKEIKLDEQQQEMVINMLKANDFLYTKGAKDHANKIKTYSAWQNLSLEMKEAFGEEKEAFSAEELKRWYKSARTRVQKTYKKESKSGAGTLDPERLSDKLRWLYTSFSFLRPHIVEHRPRVLVSVSIKTVDKKYQIFTTFSPYSLNIVKNCVKI